MNPFPRRPTEVPLGFERRPLDASHEIWVGSLPDGLLRSNEHFEALWDLHPPEFPTIKLRGRLVPLPRWQEAYGANYRFSGITMVAMEIPDVLEPFFEWARDAADVRLNGALLNWYDGKLGHYIGRHRDSTIGMVIGAPIVTISLGETRVFRVRKWKGAGVVNFLVSNGSALVMPYATNLAWTHEIPKTKRATGRRISITLRAFE